MSTCPHCGEELPRRSKYPQVSIILRKHPLGFRSPTGKFQVRSMALEEGTMEVPGKKNKFTKYDMIRVEIMHNGYQAGWAFPLKEYTPWIRFNIEGSSQPFGIGSAWAYWQKHNGPAD